MTIMNASQARIPRDVFKRVADKGERIRIKHRSGESVIMISEEDLAIMKAAEDLLDVKAAHEALSEMKTRGEKTIAWERVKKRFGLMNYDQADRIDTDSPNRIGRASG